VTGATENIDACHTGPHGLGIKAGDETCVPLTRWLHTAGPFALDRIGPKLFQQLFKVDLAAEAARLREEWRLKWFPR
jgi:hypothetical protein